MSIDILSELRTMAGNAPARPAYVTDLYVRAGAEIAHLRAECEKRGSTILDLQVQVDTARNDALEQAAMAGYVACATTRHVTLGNKVKAAIRALKEPKP